MIFYFHMRSWLLLCRTVIAEILYGLSKGTLLCDWRQMYVFPNVSNIVHSMGCSERHFRKVAEERNPIREEIYSPCQ
jgi:hypothetical protein